ncbi:hypothetical protein V2O64_09285 [Verrucomicrobiaceae bacterium 227]
MMPPPPGVFEMLTNKESGKFENHWKGHFASWLQMQAPVPFLQEHRKTIIAASKNAAIWSDEGIAEQFHDITEVRSLTPDQAFSRLDEICLKAATDKQYGFDHWGTAESLVAQLKGADSSVQDLVWQFLENHYLENNNEQSTDFRYEVYLNAAGPLKIEKAVPHLLKAMLLDWESLNENIPAILSSLASPAIIERVGQFYQENLNEVGDDHYNYLSNYLSSFFKSIDLDLAGEKACELMTIDRDPGTQRVLALAGANRLRDDLITPAYEFWTKSLSGA